VSDATVNFISSDQYSKAVFVLSSTAVWVGFLGCLFGYGLWFVIRWGSNGWFLFVLGGCYV
jgi:hypothetical protein